MIYVLHGENIPAIREFILKLQKDNKVGSKKELILEDTTPAEIMELISSVDMFGATPMVILDVTKMGRTNVDAYINALSGVPEGFVFVVFAGKGLSKANSFVKNSVKIKARVVTFKELAQSNIFKFVDYVLAGNRVAAYKELRKLILAGEDSFYIFSMLTFGLRNVTYAKFNSPAYDKLAPFIKSKAKSQASKFNEGSIISLYDRFYTLDVEAKIGKVSPEILVPLGVEAILANVAFGANI